MFCSTYLRKGLLLLSVMWHWIWSAVSGLFPIVLASEQNETVCVAIFYIVHICEHVATLSPSYAVDSSGEKHYCVFTT